MSQIHIRVLRYCQALPLQMRICEFNHLCYSYVKLVGNCQHLSILFTDSGFEAQGIIFLYFGSILMLTTYINAMLQFIVVWLFMLCCSCKFSFISVFILCLSPKFHCIKPSHSSPCSFYWRVPIISRRLWGHGLFIELSSIQNQWLLLMIVTEYGLIRSCWRSTCCADSRLSSSPCVRGVLPFVSQALKSFTVQLPMTLLSWLKIQYNTVGECVRIVH